MVNPHAPTVTELMRAAVAAAVMAPSSHNSQPWRFRLVGTRLELHADPSRHLQVIDAEQRQMIVSCGCALYNARLAIRSAGYRDEVEVTAGRFPPGLLAVLGIGRPAVASVDDRELALAIPHRHTNRRAFRCRPVAAAITDQLVAAAAARGVAMARLDPAQKRTIAYLVQRADRAQYADAAFRDELARWLVPAGSLRHDGIPFVEKEYGSALPFTVTRTLRAPDLGATFGELEGARVSGSPAVLVLGTPTDGPRDWLRCGEALQDVLLRATTLGLSAAFLNQALEIPAFRARVATAVPDVIYPQMIIRLGVPAAPVRHAAPRRSIDDVLDVVW